jgi:hydroxymethylbilane synthase
MKSPFIKLGTRGSPLALAQAHAVKRQLAERHNLPDEAIEIIIIKTTGDQIQDRALAEAGGKGLFTKELDQALIDGKIDCAVHSSKDLPTFIPAAIDITAFPQREDPRDAFISTKARTLMDLPHGATLGSASLRRQSMALRLRPDLNIVLLRGNVETRLRKVETGEIDATLLALAGLNRLGLTQHVTSILDLHDFIPAVGQGAVAITSRRDDDDMRSALAQINHAPTAYAVTAERAFLTVLDGSCRTPIGGYAHISDQQLRFIGIVLSKNGSRVFQSDHIGVPEDATQIGEYAAQKILDLMPQNFLA